MSRSNSVKNVVLLLQTKIDDDQYARARFANPGRDEYLELADADYKPRSTDDDARGDDDDYGDNAISSDEEEIDTDNVDLEELPNYFTVRWCSPLLADVILNCEVLYRGRCIGYASRKRKSKDYECMHYRSKTSYKGIDTMQQAVEKVIDTHEGKS